MKTIKDNIVEELRHHTPFTIFGAVTGILIMFLAKDLPHEVSHRIFYILHPAHVLFSAIVVASMYQLHTCKTGMHKCKFWKLLLIGYAGAVIVATLSDSLIPYAGEKILNMPNSEPHIGFLEEWQLVNPAAILGVVIAYFWPQTKLPHAAHVLVSTWASLFHMIMAFGGIMSWATAAGVFVFLFLAVWLPCCLSDIVFPLLFVRSRPAE